MKKIAVVILTKNEEKNIVAVIENVRKITDEIINMAQGFFTVNGIMIFQLSAILF